MKLKYYLRGLGIGIIVTTIILMICFSTEKAEISDDDVIKRAKELGMVMPQESETDEVSETEEGAVPSEKTGETGGTALNDPNMIMVNTSSETTIVPSETAEISSEEAVASSEMSEISDKAKASSSEIPKMSSEISDETPSEVPVPQEEPKVSGTYHLVIQTGDVCRTVCDTLMANGIVEDSERFRQYLSEMGYASQLSTGGYDIPYGITMEEVAQVLAAGPIERQE